MRTYKNSIRATILSVFIASAIALSIYILSLPLTQIAHEGCNGFAGYHLTNCIAYYQRIGTVSVLQHYAYTALSILWSGVLIGSACSFFVFPRICFTRTLQVYIVFLGLLTTLLLICLPLILFTELSINGCIFALSLVIGFLACELALISKTKGYTGVEELVSLLS